MTPTRAATSDLRSAGDAEPTRERERAPELDAASRSAASADLFCDHHGLLLARAAQLLADALRAGARALAIVARAHADELMSALAVAGLAVEQLAREGALVVAHADDLLATPAEDDEEASAALRRRTSLLLAGQLELLGAEQPLHVYSELPQLLWDRGDRIAALEAEAMGEEQQRLHGERLRSCHAIAGFLRSLHAPGLAALQRGPAPSALELERRAELEQALRAALRRSRAKLATLRESEEQLRDFVENGALGLHRVSGNGTIVWANQAELQLLGYGADEYIGHSIREFHVDEAAIQDILTRLARGETLHNYEARLRAKDGSIKHVLISSSVYRRGSEFVHTRCFTRDVTDRHRADSQLRSSEERLQRIADALPVLISFVDGDLRYQFVNATYERWFGISRGDILGRQVKDVLGDSAFALAAPHLERALSGTISSYEAELPYAHGGTRAVQAMYLPNVDPKTGKVAGYIGLVSDISERRRLEQLRASAALRAEKLLNITAAVANAVTSAQVFEAIVDHVAEGAQASSVGLWLIEADERVARLARGIGYSEKVLRELALLPLDGASSLPLLDALRTEEPVWIPSQAALLARYPHLSGTVSDGRSYRIACLPLLAEQRTLGVLGITIEEPGDANEEERDFFLLVARYGSQAILRMRLLEAEQRSRREATLAAGRLGVLNRVSRVFAETALKLDERLSGVAAELSDVLGSCTNVLLLNDEGLLNLSAVHHPDPAARQALKELAIAAPLRVGEGITGTIAANGQSVLLPSLDAALVAERAAPAYRDFLRRFPAYAMIGAPLRVQGRIIGVVTATRVGAGETYSADDLRLLEELAQRASVSIENARLYEQAVEARALAEQLYRFAQAVVEAEHVSAVYDAAFVALERALGTKRAAILRADREGVMRFRAWRGLSDGYRAAVEGHNPWRGDELAPAPVLVPDALGEPSLAGYRELFLREGIGALAFVPLLSGGRLLGKFMLYYGAPHSVTRVEVETARAIANHLGSVIVRFETVAALEETVRNNELLAGVLAHDLRNPLAAIMTAAQLVLTSDQEEGPSGANTRVLGKILSSGGRMKVMIEQLLDFTRARSGGGIGIDPRQCDLAALAEQALDELELTRPQWRIERRIMGDPVGSWDPDRILQVVSNLASNAGQHGRAGGIIRVTVDGTQADRVLLEVHNEGAIAAERPQDVFDPFRSFAQPRSRTGGLGLGLFIVSEIVKAHGGDVQVVSSEGHGTSFIARFPRRNA